MPESLQAKLAAARRRWRSVAAAGGAAASFALLTAVCLVSFHTDRLTALTTPGRMAWLIGLLAAIAGSALVFLLLPLRRPLEDEMLAAEVERKYPALNERLLTTIELARAGAGAGVSTAMISQVALDTERMSVPLDFVRAIPTDSVKRPAMFAGIAAVAFMGHVALMPNEMSVWARRIMNPGADIPLYARTQVWVGPGDMVVPRGEDVELAVKTQGSLPDSAVLHYKFENGKWSESELKRFETPRVSAATDSGEIAPESRIFRFKLADAQQSLTYYATAGDGRANPHTIRVEDRPTILNVKLNLDYPAYMHRRSEVVSATAGNIVAPVGTRVAIEATANKPLKSVTLVRGGKEAGAWAVSGETARGGLTVAKDENYGLRLKDEHDFNAANPPQYSIRAQPDAAPQVQIVKPGTDLERSPGGMIGLKVTATDDYGVADMRLVYHVGKTNGSLSLPGGGGSRQAASGGPWNLAALNLKAGDTVTYEAIAHDNDNITGPHVGRSSTYNIRIIGAGELKERLEAAKAQEREALKQLIQHQKDAQTQLAQAQKTAKPDAAAQAQQAQRNVAQETADLTQRMQQTSEQLRDNNMASQTEQKQRQAAEQKLQSLAQKAMPQAADSIQKRDLPGAARQEQDIRRQLERMTQDSAPPPDAFQLAQKADQLSQAQQKLAEQAALKDAQMGKKSPAEMTPQERASLNALAKKQAELKQQTQALEKQIQQAAKSAQEQKQSSAGDLKDAARQMQQSGVQQKQQSAQQNLQQGQPQEASPKQNEAAKDLQNLAKSLEQAAINQQSAEAMKKRSEQLEKIADQLIEMANKQLKVSEQTRSPEIKSDMVQNLMKQEQDLQNQAQQITPQLNDMQQAQQLVQRAGQNMQDTSKSLDKKDNPSANSTAREATRQLLQAAQELRGAAQSMQQAQATKEAQRQVERLARDQRDLHKQTQQLDAARQEPNLTPAQQQEVQKQSQALAQSQEKLEQRAQELKQDQPSQAFRWAMDQAGRRMDGAKRNLQQRNPGADTQRQQENAAQTLERIARALQQQSEGQQQQAEQQQSGQEGGPEKQQAQAQGELQLAREMEAQLRQETASVEQRRSQNPDHRPTAEQEREIDQLAQAQRETQQITKRAADQLKNNPQLNKMVQQAANEMDDVRDRLRQKQTDGETQSRQEKIVDSLDQALGQIRQAMRQQRQQMAQSKQKPGQKPGEQVAQGQQPSSQGTPKQNFDRLLKQQLGAFHNVNQVGKGFQNMSPRDQQALREGRQERVPAEYRDIVNQYYKALSERGK